MKLGSEKKISNDLISIMELGEIQIFFFSNYCIISQKEHLFRLRSRELEIIQFKIHNNRQNLIFERRFYKKKLLKCTLNNIRISNHVIL